MLTDSSHSHHTIRSLKDSREKSHFPFRFCSALSRPSALAAELQAAWININCSASRVLYYRSRLFSINHQLKGDCLGPCRFSSPPPLCFNTVTSWSYHDLFTASDLVNTDRCRIWGESTQKLKEEIGKSGSCGLVENQH